MDDDDLYVPESSSSESDLDISDVDSELSDDECVPLSSDEGSDSDSSMDLELATTLQANESMNTDGYSLKMVDTAGSVCIYTFKLCGDNVDKTVKVRFMRFDKGNISLHYFHSYAVLDRIDLSGLSDSYVASCLPSPRNIAASLLPSEPDDQSLKRHFSILVSRVLVTHIKFFSFGFVTMLCSGTLNISFQMKWLRSRLW